MKSKKIVIATGGTGGHVFPAYGLAKNLVNDGYDVEISTDKRGFEYLNEYQDIKVKIIKTYPISKNKFFFTISLIKIIISITYSLIYLHKFKPKLVFGMGGYSSFPLCFASRLLKIPFFIYENNLVLGKANRYLLPFTHKLMVSYKELEGVKYKYINKILEIGNIIREDIINYKVKENLEHNSKINILIVGGSQAAKSFGLILPQIFKMCSAENINLKIYQQCLKDQNTLLKNTYDKLKIENEIFNFNNNIKFLFSKVDFVISRSGSSMLAELLNCNIPVITIPLPNSADDHQLKNAKYFENKGYGFLIEENQIEPKLFQLIKLIHKDKDLLSQIKQKQKTYTGKNVFEKIKEQIKKIDG